LGIPIWITELDVTADNEHVRADDLEVILREAFAHPKWEGIVLWDGCKLIWIIYVYMKFVFKN
jgi:hypothetical protein